MKIICCLILAFICIFMCGCQTQKSDQTSDIEATFPPLTDVETDTLILDRSDYISGKIIGKISTNVLVLKLDGTEMIDDWGEIVYVITDHAADWFVGDGMGVDFTMVERPRDMTQYVRIISDKLNPIILAK